MARLARLSLPGLAHYLLQQGHNGAAIVRDVQDLEALLQALREAALSSGVVLHAYAVLGHQLHVLATPDTDRGASRMMQALGRRYAAGFNRRHGRSGGLWDGRFRCGLVEAGESRLMALRRVDAAALPLADELASVGPLPTSGAAQPAMLRSSAQHRTGGRRDPALVDPPEYWGLGNTPFERESRYRALLAEPIPARSDAALLAAVRGGWAFGSTAFVQGLGDVSQRRVAPRPRGRPRRER